MLDPGLPARRPRERAVTSVALPQAVLLALRVVARFDQARVAIVAASWAFALVADDAIDLGAVTADARLGDRRRLA